MLKIVERFEEKRYEMARELRLFRSKVWELETEDIQEAAELLEWFRFFWPTVQWYQAMEEDVLRPALERWAPASRATTAGLVAEHAELRDLAAGVHEALLGFLVADSHLDRFVWRSTLVVRATRLDELLALHFAREAEEILPLVHKHLDAQELERLDEAARGGTPRAQLAQLVPWLAAHSAPDDRRRLLRRLPLPVQLLYRWVWRKRYERSANWLLGQAQTA